MSHILIAFQVVAPVFAVIAIGYFFRIRGIIDENFVTKAMKLVFTVGLPSMLFSRVSTVDLEAVMTGAAFAFGAYAVVMTLVIFFIGRLIGVYLIGEPERRGTFTQGAFRSNYIILGYAILYNMFGDLIVPRMSLLVIVIIPLYNILSIWVLSVGDSDSRQAGLHSIFKKIVTNPLIIAIVLGFLVNVSGLKVPSVIYDTFSLLGSTGTPLGLIGIGAYLNFRALGNIREGLLAACLKIVVFPLMVVSIALMLGFSYSDSAILFVLFGSPAAISSFIMATAMGGDSRLAANIVILSTGMSLLTFIVGLTILGMIF